MVKWLRLSEQPALWLKTMREQRSPAEYTILEKAHALFTEDQQDILHTGLMIADFLLELETDIECILAALLFPLHQKFPLAMDDINQWFGHSLWRLLQDGLHMRAISILGNQHKWSSTQMEKVRGMLLAIVKDPRAVLLILAERVLHLRAVKSATKEEQMHLANESLHVYAPLANRLGVWCIKWEMEDLCLRYLNPEAYQSIAKRLDEKRIQRQEALLEIKTQLLELLKRERIKDVTINGRIKHIYSIYQKMQRKESDFSEIYDMCALRVLTNTVADCYQVLSVLQNQFQAIPQEFDDYIAQPKANGYRSIHTVCITSSGRVVEIQIRTYDMHHESELGAASHWDYKEGGRQGAPGRDKIKLLRQVMAWQKELVASDADVNQVDFPDVFADRVYVFTPLGDVIELPQAATPLDFAYYIHSEVGHRTRGAKVNGKMVPLTTSLETGNTVEILTSKFPQPSRDWLSQHNGYLKSARARSIVAHWFRVKDLENTEKNTVSLPASEKPNKPEGTESRFVSEQLELNKMVDTTPQVDIDRLLITLAKCCKPLPGDDILAYVTRMRGISIHKKQCANINHLLNTFPHKFLPTNWSKIQASTYKVDLKIKHELNHKNILKEIMGAMVDAGVEVVAIRTEKQAHFVGLILLTLTIADARLLNQAIAILTKLSGVLAVER